MFDKEAEDNKPPYAFCTLDTNCELWKDGKYPAHSNRVLVFTDEGVGFGIYGLDNQKWYTYDTGFDVIAWKEIVLPALPKEIKEK